MRNAIAFSVGHYFFHSDKLSIAKVSGISIGILGIGVIFYPQISGSGEINIAVMAILLISPIISAVSAVLTKKCTQNVQPVMLNALSTTIGFAVSLAFARA